MQYKSCNIFIIKKLWHTSIEMLSFLDRWDYCWKCEFDIDVKTENYCDCNGEQLGFYKKVYTKTQSKKNNVLVIFILGDSRNYIPSILVPWSAKRIARQILVTAKLNGKDFILRVLVCDIICSSEKLPVQS